LKTSTKNADKEKTLVKKRKRVFKFKEEAKESKPVSGLPKSILENIAKNSEKS